MTDPWLIQTADNGGTETIKEFEDNFTPTQNGVAPVTDGNKAPHEPLPDSASYLLGLERKLQKLKKGTKLIDALSSKREDCLRTLLETDSNGLTNTILNISNNNDILELETPVNSGDSTVQEIYRHLQPVRPVTLGETVHIVKYDQLEQQSQEETTEEEEEDEDKDSIKSR